MKGRFLRPLGAAAVWLGLQPVKAPACAACFGKSDSALAQGMNWGIFTLLGVIVLVLATIAAFFVYLARKSAAAAAGASVSEPKAGPRRAASGSALAASPMLQ